MRILSFTRKLFAYSAFLFVNHVAADPSEVCQGLMVTKNAEVLGIYNYQSGGYIEFVASLYPRTGSGSIPLPGRNMLSSAISQDGLIVAAIVKMDDDNYNMFVKDLSESASIDLMYEHDLELSEFEASLVPFLYFEISPNNEYILIQDVSKTTLLNTKTPGSAQITSFQSLAEFRPEPLITRNILGADIDDPVAEANIQATQVVALHETGEKMVLTVEGRLTEEFIFIDTGSVSSWNDVVVHDIAFSPDSNIMVVAMEIEGTYSFQFVDISTPTQLSSANSVPFTSKSFNWKFDMVVGAPPYKKGNIAFQGTTNVYVSTNVGLAKLNYATREVIWQRENIVEESNIISVSDVQVSSCAIESFELVESETKLLLKYIGSSSDSLVQSFELRDAETYTLLGGYAPASANDNWLVVSGGGFENGNIYARLDPFRRGSSNPFGGEVTEDLKRSVAIYELSTSESFSVENPTVTLLVGESELDFLGYSFDIRSSLRCTVSTEYPETTSFEEVQDYFIYIGVVIVLFIILCCCWKFRDFCVTDDEDTESDGHDVDQEDVENQVTPSISNSDTPVPVSTKPTILVAEPAAPVEDDEDNIVKVSPVEG